MKEHNDLILELPGFVPESICKHIIERFERMDSSKWILEDKKIFEYVKSASELYFSVLTKEYDYDQPMHTFAPLLSKYKKYGIQDHGYLIQKQLKGEQYKWHFDQEIGIVDSYLSGILYLNTLSEDEGGCTEFINGRKIRPECGKMLLSPANWTYAHCENVVKSDHKYILTFMIYTGKPNFFNGS